MDLAIAHGVCSTGAHEHHTLRGADLDVRELRAVEVKGIVRQDLGRQKSRSVGHCRAEDKSWLPDCSAGAPEDWPRRSSR